MLFDTGSTAPVKVPPTFVSPAAFAGGCRDGRLAKISLGSLATDAQLCPLLDRTGYPFSVGAPVFAQYREVVIDYPDNRLQFVK